jgi:hypothetical protein
MSRCNDEFGCHQGSVAMPRHGRRLSDKCLAVRDHACVSNDLEVEEQLLSLMCAAGG